MLSDGDRNIRKQALTELSKAINSVKDKEILNEFYRDKLCKRLVLCLEDQIEKNREVSLEMLTTCLEHCGFKEEAQIILPAVCKRMNATPYPEPCKFYRFFGTDVPEHSQMLTLRGIAEEVRVALIDFLDLCLDTDST